MVNGNDLIEFEQNYLDLLEKDFLNFFNKEMLVEAFLDGHNIDTLKEEYNWETYVLDAYNVITSK